MASFFRNVEKYFVMIKKKSLLRNLISDLKSQCRCGNLSCIALKTLNPENNEPKVCSASQFMQNYFRNRDLLHIFQNLPQDYYKRYKYTKFTALVDPKIAKRIAYVISSRLDVEYVVESDPGLGFMSEIFVSSAPYLKLCELNDELRFKLNGLKETYAKKVDIVDVNFNRLSKMMNSYHPHSMEKIASFFENFPKRSWDNDVNVSFIVTVLSKRLMRDICQNTILNETLNQCGRPEYYCLIPMNIYQALTATPKNEFKEYYRSTAVLFQIVFDHEVLLDGIPRNVILPWPSVKKEESEKSILVIRAVPKINFFSQFCDKNLFRSFINFINDNVRKEKKVIHSLENYVTNCGPLFIVNYGLSCYSEFVELAPQNIASLFLQLSKLPGFTTCSLCMSQRIKNNDVSDSDEEDDKYETSSLSPRI